jgi:predicted dehydrogenase
MAKKDPVYGRMLRMGMVGGGPGAFIGDIHRKAARMDGQVRLVAGAFSSSPRKAEQTGREQFVAPERTYGSWREMIEKERALPDEARIDFVSVVTPNHLHFPVAGEFLRAGFHVVCDKPMTLNVKEARELKKIVQGSGKVFMLTHTYAGYPMVKLARDMVRQGDLGKVLKVVVRYPQGWLIRPIERMGAKQAEWRTDPKRAGAAGCMADIGTHAENLVEYITALTIKRLCADLTRFIEGRPLDDDGNCLLQFEGGAKGVLYASQISTGEKNALTIDVHGEKKSLHWRQEAPDSLLVRQVDGPAMIWRRGTDYVARKSAGAARATRLPPGHPEGFIEAFGNLYANAAETIRANIAGVKPDPRALDFPNVDDGVRGMQFIEAVVKSARGGAKWVNLPK